MKSNGYINMTKLCDNNNKEFKNWKRNKSSQELIEFLISVAQIPSTDLFIEIAGG